MQPSAAHPEISVVIPCLNEESTIAACVGKASSALHEMGAPGEVIVVDNGSTDSSAARAEAAGARVVREPRRGYGQAYLAGFAAARGRYLVMGDADDTYDFSGLKGFVEPLRDGADMVMGTRLKGRIEPGAMPWHHRYLGVPALTGVLNMMFGAGISDAHCGMRSITRSSLASLNLRSTGMEFASEMIIKAARARLRIMEIPITLHRGGRPGRPHLRSFRDGWRHLKMMFMLSPTHLFVIPGAVLLALGAALMLTTGFGPLHLGGVLVDYHWMILGSLMAVLGFNILNIGFFARIFALTEGFESEDRLLARLFSWLNLERGLLAGAGLALAGMVINGKILWDWLRMGYSFGGEVRIRPALCALTLTVIGVQLFFSSFFYSILGNGAEAAGLMKGPARPADGALLCAGVTLAALAARLLHLAAIRHHPWWELATIWRESDMYQFLEWARHLAAGDWLDADTFRAWFGWQDGIAPREVWSSWFGAHAYYQPPLYPYLVAAGLKLTGSLDAVRIAQLALGAVNCGLLALLTSRIFGKAAGWLTGLAAAIYAPFIFYDAEILRNTIVLTTQITLLLALASRRFLPAGICLALAWLADSSVIVFVPLAAIWIWWDSAARLEPAAGRPRWRRLALFAAGAAIGVAPLCARNVAVGAPLLSSTTRAPLAFVMGNAPDANPAGAVIPASTGDILRASGYGMLSTMRETLRGYQGHYAPLVGKQWQKLIALFGSYELPDNPSFYYAARLSPVLHWGLRFLPVAGLGLAGLCLALPLARRDPLMALLPLHLAACVGLFLLAHVVSRYRQPLLISLLPLASFALLQAAAGFHSPHGKISWRGPAILAAAATLCAVLPHHPPEGYGYNRPAEFVLVAQLYEQRGEIGAAIGELTTAAQLAERESAQHDFVAPLWLHAGLMQAGADRHQEAIASYRAALQWEPEMREAQDAMTLSEEALRKGMVHP